MKWPEVCARRDLQNLPFKIELNEQGQIIMSPVKVYHSAYQGKIAALLYINADGGEVLAECAVHTKKGTKVADVAWASGKLFERIKKETECSIAPEICVEVLSESNTDDEINAKKSLYFENGSKEVWICSEKGTIRFYNYDEELENSDWIPKFPKQI
ncbi:Uma2 family endonuclease [Desulfococcaceae bacterium HSG7]|nr:Uma2 family endonuclease [Desulfococcaceae bacterium HSG9]MDM8556047.1 Uma2 family endonuclease [Desulfococcaceae bacterium HSG7]